MGTAIRSDFVVYAYVRENDDEFGKKGTFYYIGKGLPKRPYSRNRYIERPESDSNIIILHTSLDEKTAYAYERSFVLFYGRVETCPGWGILLNSTDGGGGTSGYKWNSNSLVKISGSNHHKSKLGNWCHREVGFVGSKTATELEKMFPRHRIKATSLRELANGRFKVYRGWVYIPDNEVNTAKKGGDLSVIFSPEYARQRIREHMELKSLSKRGANNLNYKPRNWCHVAHGLVLNKSCSDVARLYADTGASETGLCRIALGKSKFHKGWVFIPEDLIKNNPCAEGLEKTFNSEYAKNEIEKFKVESVRNNPMSGRVGELNPMFGKTGELHPSYGSKRTEETCKKISEKARSRFARRDWGHPIHGVVRNVLYCELIEMFPEQNLSQGNLFSVANGHRSQHKGWKFLRMSVDLG
jgi:hypothetical protein